MSIKEVTYYQVHCDESGCDVKTGDMAEYSAFGEASQAKDDWEDGDGIVCDDGRTFCGNHTLGKRCAGCDHVGTDLTMDESDEYWCPKCLADETAAP